MRGFTLIIAGVVGTVLAVSQGTPPSSHRVSQDTVRSEIVAAGKERRLPGSAAASMLGGWAVPVSAGERARLLQGYPALVLVAAATVLVDDVACRDTTYPQVVPADAPRSRWLNGTIERGLVPDQSARDPPCPRWRSRRRISVAVRIPTSC